jgi:hypothetical protein
MSNLDQFLSSIRETIHNNKVFSVLIYGESKVGKTILATTVQGIGKTILLNFENRCGHIQETDNLIIYPSKSKICTQEDLDKLLSFLKNDPSHGIKNVIIDTIDTLFKDQVKVLAQSKKATNSLNFDERNGIIYSILDLIDVLKGHLGLNVVIVAHQKFNDKLGKMTVSLDRDLFNFINNKTDYVFCYVKNEQNQRILITSSGQYETGASLEINEQLPELILDPDLSTIFGSKVENEPFISMAQRQTLVNIGLIPEKAKEIIAKYGYNNSAEILQKDFMAIYQEFQQYYQQHQSLPPQNQNYQPQPQTSTLPGQQLSGYNYQDFENLIMQSANKTALEAVKELINNDQNLTRDNITALQKLMLEKEASFVA